MARIKIAPTPRNSALSAAMRRQSSGTNQPLSSFSYDIEQPVTKKGPVRAPQPAPKPGELLPTTHVNDIHNNTFLSQKRKSPTDHVTVTSVSQPATTKLALRSGKMQPALGQDTINNTIPKVGHDDHPAKRQKVLEPTRRSSRVPKPAADHGAESAVAADVSPDANRRQPKTATKIVLRTNKVSKAKGVDILAETNVPVDPAIVNEDFSTLPASQGSRAASSVLAKSVEFGPPNGYPPVVHSEAGLYDTQHLSNTCGSDDTATIGSSVHGTGHWPRNSLEMLHAAAMSIPFLPDASIPANNIHRVPKQVSESPSVASAPEKPSTRMKTVVDINRRASADSSKPTFLAPIVAATNGPIPASNLALATAIAAAHGQHQSNSTKGQKVKGKPVSTKSKPSPPTEGRAKNVANTYPRKQPFKAQIEYPGYPPFGTAIPDNYSLWDICQNLPNSLRESTLLAFVQREWSANELCACLKDDVREILIARPGKDKTMVYQKRLERIKKDLVAKQEYQALLTRSMMREDGRPSWVKRGNLRRK